jgi:hypothetical protein
LEGKNFGNGKTIKQTSINNYHSTH